MATKENFTCKYVTSFQIKIWLTDSQCIHCTHLQQNVIFGPIISPTWLQFLKAETITIYQSISIVQLYFTKVISSVLDTHKKRWSKKTSNTKGEKDQAFSIFSLTVFF